MAYYKLWVLTNHQHVGDVRFNECPYFGFMEQVEEWIGENDLIRERIKFRLVENGLLAEYEEG